MPARIRFVTSLLFSMVTLLLPVRNVVQAFNSEEHKLLVDLGVALVVPDPSIQLPYPTRFESFPTSTLHAAYTAAKNLAVGYASNQPKWHSRCLPWDGSADSYPTAYDQYELDVQDNSYWDSDHSSFNQIEGNINMWVPPIGLVRENALWVSGYLDNTVRTFTFGDLVSIYGDYRRTSFCVTGKCYLSDAPLSTIGFYRGTDCYGVWPWRTCGYQPPEQRSDVYLKRIAAGLWPPYGCAGNAFSNTCYDGEYEDAAWWGDEMMRIANVNDWHFSSAAVAWYIGMHRLALLYVDAARSNPIHWNTALHYEANALHSLTDLFCFGHIATNRDETSRGIMEDEQLTADLAYQWMENVIAKGGGTRNAAGRVQLGALPAIADRTGERHDFLPSYQGVWAGWSVTEHGYHDSFNHGGATVRNLRGDQFFIRGDGEVRHYSAFDRDVIVNCVRTSLQALFDAYVQLQDGATVAALGSTGSSYFDALRWTPVFVESEAGNHFKGRWTRYAGALEAITAAGVVPANWANCQMAYVNGGTEPPGDSESPCTTFPEPTGVWVENLGVQAEDGRVVLTWGLGPEAVRELQSLQVQRADRPDGPYANRTEPALGPKASMTFEDLAVEAGSTYWYRFQLHSTNGSITTVGPIEVVVGSGAAFRTMIVTPGIPASGPVELRFSLARSIGAARLDLYDMRGRLVRNLAQGLTEPGHYLLTWDRRDDEGRNVGSGIYVLRLRAADAGDSKKLVLIGE